MRRKIHNWSSEQISILKDKYADSSPDEIVAALDNKFSARQIAYKAKKNRHTQKR